MGYFSNQDAINKEEGYDREFDERNKAPKKEFTELELINLICQNDPSYIQKREELEKCSLEKLKLMYERASKKYKREFFIQYGYGKKEKNHEPDYYEEEENRRDR